MGSKLFGVDVAALVNSQIAPGLLDLTLTKVTPGTRTPGQLTAGTNPTTTTHTGKGIIEDFKTREIDGTLILVGDKSVLLVTESLTPAATPDGGDRLAIEGDEYSVVRILERDPAGATYKLHVRA